MLDITLGCEPWDKDIMNFIKGLVEDDRFNLHSLHFPHWDDKYIYTGRKHNPRAYKAGTEYFLAICKSFNVKTSVLINYTPEPNIPEILKIVKWYVDNGCDAVTVSHKDVIRAIHKEFPSLEIQGSCISLITDIEGIEEERELGVTLHNPSTEVIRDIEFMKEMNRKGYPFKLIFGDGCIANCPFAEECRSWIANDLKKPISCSDMAKKDMRLSFLGCWVTLERLKYMEDNLPVLKLPRTLFSTNRIIAKKQLDILLDRYFNDTEYNVLEYNISHLDISDGIYVSSKWFDNEFFDFTRTCNMECEKLQCTRCLDIFNKIENSEEKGFSIQGFDWVKEP